MCKYSVPRILNGKLVYLKKVIKQELTIKVRSYSILSRVKQI